LLASAKLIDLFTDSGARRPNHIFKCDVEEHLAYTDLRKFYYNEIHEHFQKLYLHMRYWPENLLDPTWESEPQATFRVSLNAFFTYFDSFGRCTRDRLQDYISYHETESSSINTELQLPAAQANPSATTKQLLHEELRAQRAFAQAVLNAPMWTPIHRTLTVRKPCEDLIKALDAVLGNDFTVLLNKEWKMEFIGKRAWAEDPTMETVGRRPKEACPAVFALYKVIEEGVDFGTDMEALD
jgi:hypothetical protein